MDAEKIAVPGWPQNHVVKRRLVAGLRVQLITVKGWVWLLHGQRFFQVTGRDLLDSVRSGKMSGSLVLMHEKKGQAFSRPWPIALPGGWKASLFSDHVECLICGKEMKSISRTHLLSHGVSQKEYRDFFGIPKKASLAVASSFATGARKTSEAGIPEPAAESGREESPTLASVPEEIIPSSEGEEIIHSPEGEIQAGLPNPEAYRGRWLEFLEDVRLGQGEWPDDSPMPFWEWRIRMLADRCESLERAFSMLLEEKGEERAATLLAENLALRRVCAKLLAMLGESARRIGPADINLLNPDRNHDDV